ncbi:hypothetical protein PHLGIDRAFT_446013 [Phlebiopsis gigantea 11061_1 CR5-6]|uniref:Uncharacterized protein n=1 Tax=Phlebiopsis gigantea (strain 11061_1 CR5-6) TaxID=745531 RepID=A0A0C3PKI7_PHLG1|nr:hypothetical protein PHLGIDRAFT_446013 [Phlebiopsis gigantea 11061_1 CR5-6]
MCSPDCEVGRFGLAPTIAMAARFTGTIGRLVQRYVRVRFPCVRCRVYVRESLTNHRSSPAQMGVPFRLGCVVIGSIMFSDAFIVSITLSCDTHSNYWRLQA